MQSVFLEPGEFPTLSVEIHRGINHHSLVDISPFAVHHSLLIRLIEYIIFFFIIYFSSYFNANGIDRFVYYIPVRIIIAHNLNCNANDGNGSGNRDGTYVRKIIEKGEQKVGNSAKG